MKLTSRELATILAALRKLQEMNPDEYASDEEIDALCERLTVESEVEAK